MCLIGEHISMHFGEAEMRYQAPHEVRDQDKLESMIKTLEAGQQLPPIIVCGEIAYSGSHRLAAWEALDMEPEVIEIDDEDVAAGMTEMGLEPGYDEIDRFDEFEIALAQLGLV